MSTYPKIPGPYKRYTEGPDRNKLILGEWTSLELEALASSVPWVFTEKVDGTNVRVIWDGYRVEFRGRTDRAEMHPELTARLEELFPEELLEQQFGKELVTFYGEGCGPGIQKNGVRYGERKDFILFDVRIGDWWMRRPSVVEIGVGLGLRIAHCYQSLTSIPQAITAVTDGLLSFEAAPILAEGVVGVTDAGLLRRNGERIMVKVKSEDFYTGE